ncbi:hypothetical protein CRE_02553 [Caenorhabditis remanei]|uniref:Uncharacterized protein n=1 Tax=Caenorhabditis remanei TaxID=31234 RepID=E3MWW4_CAERE|nr:hypothetical protein CRE_02553 [Caenorhabditis remanei]
MSCEKMLENVLREFTARLNGVVIRERLLRIMLRMMYQRITGEEQPNADHEENKENIKPIVPE